MAITIYVAEKPSRKEDCHSIFSVDSEAEAKAHLWALAKQAKSEWAMFWMPGGLEPITSDGMKSADVPGEMADVVAAEVARLNKITMEAIITDALNTAHDELAATFFATPDFVQLLTQAAEDWAKECYQHA